MAESLQSRFVLPRREWLPSTVAVIVSSLAAAGYADTRELSADPGIVALDCGSFDGDVDVSWDAEQPIDLRFKTFELKDDRHVIVFAADPGQYVIESDVIDWDRRKRTRTTWIINVGGVPTPPSPTPTPPEPSPTPGGFAGEIYQHVKAVNEPDKASQVARAFETVGSEMAARSDMSPLEANRKVNALLNAIGLGTKWNVFARAVNNKLNANRNREGAIEIFGQIVEGIEATL